MNKRITNRDIQVAKWIAEQQAVRLDTISELFTVWGIPCKPRNLRRLAQRWEDSGLVMRKQILANAPTILWPTKSSMKLTDIADKRIEKIPSVSTLQHTLAVARVRVSYEALGADWTCERALRTKFIDQHLADGLAKINGKTALIEVERTRKDMQRLRNILSTNARTSGVDVVHYWTTPELQSFLNLQIQSIDPALRSMIQIYLLPEEVQ